MTSGELAEKQLLAYNARNLEEFLACYSSDVEVYEFPSVLTYKGKDKMRERYSKRFREAENLHCTIVNRITMGNYAIDQESVRGIEVGKEVSVCAIYYVEKNLISKVWFMRP